MAALQFLVADDNEIMRRGVKQILNEEFPGCLVTEAIDTPSLLAKALRQQWDFIITEVAMPGGTGLEAIKKIKAQKKSLPVLSIGAYSEDQFSSFVISAGGDGYLSKNNVGDFLVLAIRKILEGEKYFPGQTT